MVVAEVLSVRRQRMPTSSPLCEVSDGERRYAVVCGAPNVRAGGEGGAGAAGSFSAGRHDDQKSRSAGRSRRDALLRAGAGSRQGIRTGYISFPNLFPTGRSIVEALGLDDVILKSR